MTTERWETHPAIATVTHEPGDHEPRPPERNLNYLNDMTIDPPLPRRTWWLGVKGLA